MVVVLAMKCWLQVAATSLLPFDRLEQSFEITLSKAAATFTLNDFVEQCWPVFHGPCEDLQHVTAVVLIDQDAELLEDRDVP